jgi:hypothetical protein
MPSKMKGRISVLRRIKVLLPDMLGRWGNVVLD